MKLKTNTCLICLFLLPFVGNALFAQSAERSVLANAGNSALITGGYSVAWTLGESFVATRADTDLQIVVTEGFHQPEQGTVPTIDLPNQPGQITIAPNPAGNTLNITFPVLPATPLHALLTDAAGRTLRETDLLDLSTALDLAGLSPAWYALILSDGKNWIRSVKIIKQ